MSASPDRKELLVPSSLSEVPKASAEAIEFLKSSKLSEADLFDVKLCLEEALINAMKYGHHLDPHLRVKLLVEMYSDKAVITVEDQGKGFDPSRLGDCTSADNLLLNHGRGVHLIKQLMDDVSFNAQGNQVSMAKLFDKKSSLK